jgi:hypothetical protein
MDRTFGNSAGPKEVLMTNVCTANAGMAHLLNPSVRHAALLPDS